MYFDEKRLADGLRRGQTTAQEMFLRQYAPTVFRQIVRMTRDERDAEELTQDTLLKALNHIDAFNPARAGMQTWLCRIAYRLTLNHLRVPKPPLISIDEAANPLTMEDERQMNQLFEESDNEMTHWLLQAIDLLPHDEQTLITLFYYDDLPIRDIAYITDAPPGTIATRLHRIRKKLFNLVLKLQQP